MSRVDTQTKERTAAAATPAAANLPATVDRTIEYMPMGTNTPIKLSINIIRLILNPRTKSGTPAPDDQIMKFMMLCRARRLDPFEGDAYLIGYEGKDGDAWSLVTSIYAFLKRAEVNPEYEGIESGVIVQVGKDGPIEEHVGDFLQDHETLLGGWAIVHRSDRKFPNKKRVEYKRYSTGKSRWVADPGGMICKVAECQALRDTFPTTLGGMFVGEETERTIAVEAMQVNVLPSTKGSLKPKAEEKPKHDMRPMAVDEPPVTDQHGEIKEPAAAMTEFEKEAVEREQAKPAKTEPKEQTAKEPKKAKQSSFFT